MFERQVHEARGMILGLARNGHSALVFRLRLIFVAAQGAHEPKGTSVASLSQQPDCLS